MTTQVNTERFLEMVAKSRLVEPAALTKFTNTLHDTFGEPLPTDASKIASAMVDAKLLTSWHTDKLLAGKYKGFFLGKYKLLGHIGTGGMSSVYLAEHVRMQDKRAIKVLPRTRVKDATYLARFQLEAKAIASLSHPNIVLAYDIDNEGDTHYIVMEYVEGVDLQVLVRRDGPLPPSEAALLIAQAADGLQHAHQRGVIHRDVKPANLLLDLEGKIRLLDMGLALVAAQEEESLTIVHNENVLGTADYLAPEQAINSHNVDHRADIYGLGCTLYFLLTGKPPFPDGSLAQRIAKHQREMPPSIRKTRNDVPGELEGICVKMMQKDAQYRYQSAADAADALRKFAAHSPSPKSLAAARAGAAGLPVGSSSRGSGASRGSSRGSGSSVTIEHDTVSAKGDETLAGNRAAMLRKGGLSASDSGRLVSTTSTATDLFGDSLLDLEIESGYRDPQKTGSGKSGTAGKSAAEKSAALTGRRSDGARLVGDGSEIGSEILTRGKAGSDVLSGSGSFRPPGKSSIANRSRATAAGRSQVRQPQASGPDAKPTISRWLIAISLILFLLAIAIGYALAILTS